MEFKKAEEIEAVCWQMRQADWPRGKNRARINDLFNGFPPYTEEEVQANGVVFNVNDLSSTRVGHDARSQFYSAFLKPGNYFRMTSDYGPKHKRGGWSQVVTREMNKVMKRSLDYFECFRSKFALDVLHGIGPSVWRDSERWCPDPLGVEDILIPAKTLLTMRNLPLFAIQRQFTAPELMKLTRGPKIDPGWNMPLVEDCLKWIDKETLALTGSQFPDVWKPEAIAERIKGDGGFYTGDQVPTINCFDFYYFHEDSKGSGWHRKIILDAWSAPDGEGKVSRTSSGPGGGKSNFLYENKGRVFADKRESIVAFQFADLSAVAPFQYHSVRSLGFMLYAVCHVQNRLKCKVNEAVFEALMMLFRVKGEADSQRALKLVMANRGFVDESIQFIPAAERFQVQAGLVELGLTQNDQTIRQNATSYTQNSNFSQDKTEKTAFQVMAEQTAVTNLVSSALVQAYRYQNYEYYEIQRRFFKKNSRDPEVLAFRANVLRQGVPEKILIPECWESEPERILGAGNKSLEMAISEQLMTYRNLFDPEPQRAILRDFVLATTDDPGRATSLVPEEPVKVTDSVHDAQLAAGTLMQQLPVAIKTGMNHVEYVETLMASMALIIQRAMKQGLTSPEILLGLQNVAAHINAHIQIIAQDEKEKARVKVYGDQLGKLNNEVKALQQRLQEHMQSQNGQGQMDETQAKIQAQQMQAEAKMQNTRESHGQRTAQRQIQFELEQKRKQEEHQADMQRQMDEHALDMKRSAAEAVADIELAKIKEKNKPKPKAKASGPARK